MIAVLLLAGGLLLQTGAAAPRMQRGIEVQPDTVTVGDPFWVRVRLRTERGATIAFPTTPDSSAVEALDRVVVTTSSDSTVIEQTATYRVAAWDVGHQPIRFADVLVSIAGTEHRVSLDGISVFVRSVLPADSTLHVEKPQRGVLELTLPWWRWLLVALAVIAVLLLLWWLYRRLRRRANAMVVRDPWAVAEEEFARVEAMGLVAAGERGRYVSLMVEVLRDYLARVISQARPSLTTVELLGALRGEGRVPANRLAALLAEADLVKFARRSLTSERAAQLGDESRAIAAAVHGANDPAVQVERAA
jgi:hypothetical protein